MTENKSASNQTERLRKREETQQGLSFGGPSSVGGGGGFPGQSGAAREASVEEAGWSGWGLGLGVPSVQPSCHGHGDKERS